MFHAVPHWKTSCVLLRSEPRTRQRLWNLVSRTARGIRFTIYEVPGVSYANPLAIQRFTL